MDISNDTGKIKEILRDSRVIAVVGASPRGERPSNMVARYLIKQEYKVVPVRPKVSKILGLDCYSDLELIPGRVDIVDVFRRPEACVDIARSAVKIGASVLWLQEGIRNDEAMRVAESGGLAVVMDRCIKVEHQRLLGKGS